MKKPVFIFVDRDGTINKDENYYLGSSPNWKSQVEFLPKVIEGLKLMNKIPDSKLIIVTNQSGVALAGPKFDELTLDRANEVNEYVISELANHQVKIDAYFVCPYVNPDYVLKAKEKGREVISEFVYDNHKYMKPNIGMMQDAVEKFGYTLDDVIKFMVGDRISDVEFGLAGKAFSVIIESFKTRELGDLKKIPELRQKNPHRIYVANDFFGAAEIVDLIYREKIQGKR